MSLRSLTVQGFRNLKDTELDFSEHFNFIIGDNGTGKTNILEALFYIGLASSFRAREDKVLIRFGESHFRVSAETENREASVFYDGTCKKITLQGNEMKRLSEFVGWLGITMLSIEDLWIVRGAPSKRRSYLDWMIAKASPLYLDDLIEHRKLVRQRNRVLQTMHNNGNIDLLDAYNERFISISNAIYRERQRYLPMVKEHIKENGEELGLKRFTLEYQCTCRDMELDLDQLDQVRDLEMQLGHTRIGPHRDDLVFFINDHSLRSYASEGQERAAAISLKLAESRIIEQCTGTRPLLLLDEAGAELDNNKKNTLVSMLQGQVFYASTTTPEIPEKQGKDSVVFYVKAGEIEKTASH